VNFFPLPPSLRPRVVGKPLIVIMSRSHQDQDLLPSASAVITSRLIDAMAKMLPSQQEKRGDRKLDKAREIVSEFESVISQQDRAVIEERITL
jgi:hypothetical protein